MIDTSYAEHQRFSWMGVVLASGQSSRMGRDKAMLLWDGTPLYQQMARLLKEAGAEQVLINRSGDESDCIADIYPGRGPLSGVHSALQHCQNSAQTCAVIVVPVDMPLLKPEHVTELLRNFDGIHPVQYQDYSLPLLLPNTDKTRVAVEQAITSNNRRNYALWRLFEKLAGQTLSNPADHQETFANTNTPEEWQACQVTAE